MLDPADSRKFKGTVCCKKPKLTLFLYRNSNDLNPSDQHISGDNRFAKNNGWCRCPLPACLCGKQTAIGQPDGVSRSLALFCLQSTLWLAQGSNDLSASTCFESPGTSYSERAGVGKIVHNLGCGYFKYLPTNVNLRTRKCRPHGVP